MGDTRASDRSGILHLAVPWKVVGLSGHELQVRSFRDSDYVPRSQAFCKVESRYEWFDGWDCLAVTRSSLEAQVWLPLLVVVAFRDSCCVGMVGPLFPYLRVQSPYRCPQGSYRMKALLIRSRKSSLDL